MRNPPRKTICDFCGDPIDAVELMFRSKLGGDPPRICSDCIEKRFKFIEEYHRDPTILVAAVAPEYNAIIGGRA